MTKGEWVDISSESARTYIYPGDVRITIREPQRLFVSEIHEAHKIATKTGEGYYLQPGWLVIMWNVPTYMDAFHAEDKDFKKQQEKAIPVPGNALSGYTGDPADF